MSHVVGWTVGAVLAVAGVGVPMWWLTSSRPDPDKETPQLPVFKEPDDKQPPKKTEFATGGGGGEKAADVKFDGAQAVKYVKQLCDIGPRISGTNGMKKQQELIEAHFKKLGATVTRQEFKARQNSQKNETDFVNLIVTWHPEKERRIILCSHYDTRPIADQEANPLNWNKPFVSANDGTSGVALMMELGNHMKDLKSEFGVDFVFFDGEEYVFKTDDVLDRDKYFIGSEYFANEYKKSKGTRKYRYESGALFDLCTAKGAVLKVEEHSWEDARKVVEQIWSVAKDVGAKSFKFEAGDSVQDDHLALNRVGIPTVDIIDFRYPHWHKLTDTADKIDPGQMEEVAKVIATWLQKIK